MTLADLGSLGEFVGSIAALVTVVYLALQLRHGKELLERNQKIALSQAYQARVDSRRELVKIAIELAYIYTKFHDGSFQDLTRAKHCLLGRLTGRYAARLPT